MKSNGETRVEDATTDELLAAIFEALVELNERVEEVVATQAELREAIANVSTPGVDWGVDE